MERGEHQQGDARGRSGVVRSQETDKSPGCGIAQARGPAPGSSGGGGSVLPGVDSALPPLQRI